MCDYSLMAVPNRLAREGEDLVVYRFPTGSLGLASAADVRRQTAPRQGRPKSLWGTICEFFAPGPVSEVCAVCIPPGASLRLRDIPARLQREFGIADTEDVMFTQVTAAAHAYRDSVRFASGRTVLLQNLDERQRVRVLDLSEAVPIDLSQLRELDFIAAQS